jgi:hypothetical protein
LIGHGFLLSVFEQLKGYLTYHFLEFTENMLHQQVGIHPDGALARGTAPDPDIPKDVAGAQWYEVPGIWCNTVERLSWTMVGKQSVYGCKFRQVQVGK